MRELLSNRYRIGEPLGGGMAADVYLARDELLERDIAVKVLRPQYANDKEFVERFRREAKSAASLSHPNIVSIHDRGETEDGTYYIVMEYLPRGTLKERIVRKGPLAPDAAIGLAIQIAEALKAAHEKGVIHRDIKPQNVLVSGSGDVKVADFGIARAASASTLTRTGHVLGSLPYMSPEQATGNPVGSHSDLYSLGVVLYEMLTGELPFEAQDPMGVLMKHVNGLPRSPKEVNPEVPEGLSVVTTRLLAKDPTDRYPSAAELIDELGRVRKGWRPTSATTKVLRRPVEPRRPRPEERTQRTKRYEDPAPPGPPEVQRPFSNLRRRIRRAVIGFVITVMILLGLALAGVAAFGPEPGWLWDSGPGIEKRVEQLLRQIERQLPGL